MLINKKIVIAIFAVVAFLLVTIFYYAQTQNGGIMSFKRCNYADDTAAFTAAVNEGDSDTCYCIDDNEMQKKCINQYIDQARMLAHMGSMEFKEKEYGMQSVEILEKILKSDSKNIEALTSMGYSYEIMEQYDDALGYYEEALKLDENNYEIYSKIGHLYDLKEGFEKAEFYYQKSAELKSDSIDAKYNLARGYYRNDRVSEAQEVFEEIFNIEGIDKRTKAELGYLLATISMDFGAYDDAQTYIDIAKESDPTLPIVWVGLGLVRIAEVESANSEDEASVILNEAIAHFDKALSIYNDSTMAHYWKGRILSLSGNEELAQESFARARDSVDRDISLMQDEKDVLRVEIERFISEKDKTSYFLRGLINEAHAGQNIKWYGSSYSGFKAAVAAETARSGHHFSISGNTATCNNGWSLTWIPTCTARCGSWSRCSKDCGDGKKSRSCTRSDCSTYTDRQSCNTHPCPVDGECSSKSKTTHSYETNSISGLCSKGTASPSNSLSFPSGKYGAASRITWKCNGLHGGSNASCAAQRVPPKAACNTNHPVTSLPPTINLCKGCDNCNLDGPHFANNEWTWTCTHKTNPGAVPQSATCKAQIPAAECNNITTERNDPSNPPSRDEACGISTVFEPAPTLGVDGRWSWYCKYEPGYANPPIAGPCYAPTCLSRGPLDVSSSVYLDKSGESPETFVKVNCPGVCCEFESADIKDDPDDIVCYGETGKNIIVDHIGEYPAECYFDPNGPRVPQTPTITTMCTSRSCNAQGTCQATPKAAGSTDECSSTCNSDADCSRGRMIETRP